MSAVVLDASAVLAMLRDEPGSEQVAAVIAEARISAVNLAEVVSYFIHAGVQHQAVSAMLAPLPLVVANADRETAVLAGQLRAVTAAAGLSLGDRICLALAIREGLPAYTADKAWLTVAAQLGVDVVLIR